MLKPLDNYRHFAVLLVRATLGAIFIAHGGQKLFGWWGGSGIDGFVGWIGSENVQFAPILTWTAMLMEFAGGIALTLGVMTRFFALWFVISMAMAIWKVKFSQGFFGGYEYELFLLVVAFSFFLGGAGRYSIDGGFAVERK